MSGIRGVGSYLVLQFLRNRRTIGFYTALVALLAFGVSTLVYVPAMEAAGLPHHLLEEMAKACIVAAFLAGSVDVYLKRRLASDFARDISPFIEGFGLPREFQDEIAFIKRIPIYRRNYQLTYRIYRDAKPGFLRVRTTFAYEVVNPSDIPQAFALSLAVEDSHPDVGQAKVLSVGMRGDAISPFSKSEKEVTAKVEAGFLIYSEEVLIPPGSAVTAWAEGESYVEESDNDVVYLTYATANLTIHVEAPDDLDVRVYFGHRFQEMSPPKVAVIPAAPQRAHTWQISAAMLRGHSMYIEWSKTKTPPGITLSAGSR